MWLEATPHWARYPCSGGLTRSVGLPPLGVRRCLSLQPPKQCCAWLGSKFRGTNLGEYLGEHLTRCTRGLEVSPPIPTTQPCLPPRGCLRKGMQETGPERTAVLLEGTQQKEFQESGMWLGSEGLLGEDEDEA